MAQFIAIYVYSKWETLPVLWTRFFPKILLNLKPIKNCEYKGSYRPINNLSVIGKIIEQ